MWEEAVWVHFHFQYLPIIRMLLKRLMSADDANLLTAASTIQELNGSLQQELNKR